MKSLSRGRKITAAHRLKTLFRMLITQQGIEKLRTEHLVQGGAGMRR